MIKDRDANVRFTLLTGIRKFSKVNLFCCVRQSGAGHGFGRSFEQHRRLVARLL